MDVPAAVPGSKIVEPGTAISSAEIAVSWRGELGRLAAAEYAQETEVVLGCSRVFCTTGSAVLASLRKKKNDLGDGNLRKLRAS